MLNNSQEADTEHVEAIAQRLATMLGLLQTQFRVAPDVIAMVAATVLVENGGRDALEALALGAEAGLIRHEMASVHYWDTDIR